MRSIYSIIGLAALSLVPTVATPRIRSGYDFDPDGDHIPDYLAQLPRRDRNATFYDSGKPKSKRAARRGTARLKERTRVAKARRDCGHEG